jgi:hypothetical protein
MDSSDGPSAAVTPVTSIVSLTVPSWSCVIERGGIHVRGEVKNISNAPIEKVEVVGTFRTADATFVKTAEALIEYQPLLSGQTSPFDALDYDNPAILKAEISFKVFWGGRIAFTGVHRADCAR